MNPETDDLIGCLIYLLTIKKSAVVTNSIDSESKKMLVQSRVEEVPFNFEAIKRGSAELYLDLNQSRIINGVLHDFSHRLQSRMAIIEEIKHHVSCLKVRKEAITKLERGDISVLDSVDSIVQKEMELKAKQTELETQLKELDTNERVDKPGFPIKRTARSYFFWWSYIEFMLPEGGRQDDVVIDCDDQEVVALTTEYDGSKVVIQYPFWFNFGATKGNNLPRKELSYTATLHYYEPKKQQYQHKIKSIKKSIETIKRQRSFFEETRLEIEKKLQHSKQDRFDLSEQLKQFDEQIKALHKLIPKLIEANACINDVKGAMDMMSRTLKSSDLVWLNRLVDTDTRELFNQRYATLDAEDSELIDCPFLDKEAVQFNLINIEQINKKLDSLEQSKYLSVTPSPISDCTAFTLYPSKDGKSHHHSVVSYTPSRCIDQEGVLEMPSDLTRALQEDFGNEANSFNILEDRSLKENYKSRLGNLSARQAVLRQFFIEEILKYNTLLSDRNKTLLYHAKLSYLQILYNEAKKGSD